MLRDPISRQLPRVRAIMLLVESQVLDTFPVAANQP